MRKRAPRTENKASEGILTALVADSKGNIMELEGYGAIGMAGTVMAPLSAERSLPMPHGSELMFLPDRVPVLLDLATGRQRPVPENPYQPGERIFPVAGFNSPGYVHTFAPAFEEVANAKPLPLFAYGAVGWHRGGFRSAVFQIDRERRQDLRLMPLAAVRRGVRTLQKDLPQNRLRQHLEKCALTYGCPAAKNFFIGRCEAPLPTSPLCNARCLGCLSLQSADTISHCQDRITFMPSAREIAEIALVHLAKVKNGVVSFGQGCEGDPLLAAEVIEPAIREIRSRTKRGTINMNTNGSLPDVLERLFDAGLDSIRVSLNSVRESCYAAYFRPKGYCFSDVLKSIGMGIGQGRHVAINYLNMAGFTDTPEERDALMQFLDTYPISQIQWRNLNFDPLRYWQVMASVANHGEPVGMKLLVDQVKARYPHVRHGYFNPLSPQSAF
jgi:pyruvate-formate lyase-activating enzyme